MAANPDQFSTFTAIDLVPVVPSNVTDLPRNGRAIRCSGAGGTLRFVSYDGNLRDTSISAGEVLLVAVRRIHATGTTATGLEVYI